jgi:hypothetical protein
MAIKLGRDPFARQNIRRQRVNGPRTDCKNCGGQCIDRHGGRYLWEFSVDPDSGRRYPIGDGLYCSVSCFNAYNG